MMFQIGRKLEDKNFFLYIDKCHNSMINYPYLAINNPKRDILGKMHTRNLNEIRW